MKNRLLAARAQDVRDVERRVLNLLVGTATRAITADAIRRQADAVRCAGFDRTRVLGFCTTMGGASSHVAILARSFDLPAIVGVDTGALDVPDGTLVILDGTRGALTVSPTTDVVAQIRQRTAARAERQRLDAAQAHAPAVTLDRRRIEVAANAGDVEEATRAAAVGADGIGLLRTELLFMDRVNAPSEDEQLSLYRAIVEALGPARVIIIRTLDVGGDKPLPYLPLPKEDNPFLGLRGLRVGLDRRILRTRLRAILRASAFGAVRVMFPMVATLIELREARAMLDEAARELASCRFPSASWWKCRRRRCWRRLRREEVDFFSIGATISRIRSQWIVDTQARLRVDALQPRGAAADRPDRPRRPRARQVGRRVRRHGRRRWRSDLIGLGVTS